MQSMLAALVIAWSPEFGIAAEPVTLEGHTKDVNSVSWSPDGKMLASASSDGTLKLWDVATGKGNSRRGTHRKGLVCVSWVPDGAEDTSFREPGRDHETVERRYQQTKEDRTPDMQPLPKIPACP